MRHARIGCSGWNYRSWRGPFYPTALPVSDWLAHYTTVFDTVEVNNTFYRLPETTTFAAWRDGTPHGFLMAVKASRYLTHLKRLRDPAEPIARLFERAAALGDRLGPVLYQLPGSFPRDLDRLDGFLSQLPRQWTVHGARRPARRRLVHVMEFRHPSWYVPETFALLERHRVSLCLHDKDGSAISEPLVGPITYVRFHGTSGRYHGSYDEAALGRWASRLAEQVRSHRPVFVYFNNDPHAVAVQNARTLRQLLDRELASEPLASHSVPREVTMARYGKAASKSVESAMRRRKKGSLKSGSGRTVRSRKQAIAIGLSEAREKGAKVPSAKRASTTRKRKATKRASTGKTSSRKTSSRTAASGRSRKSKKS